MAAVWMDLPGLVTVQMRLLTFDTVRGGLLESATVQLDLLRFGAVQG